MTDNNNRPDLDLAPSSQQSRIVKINFESFDVINLEALKVKLKVVLGINFSKNASFAYYLFFIFRNDFVYF